MTDNFLRVLPGDLRQARMDKWVEIPAKHMQSLVASMRLGVGNIESTMRDAIRTVNLLLDSRRIDWNSS